MKKLLSVVLTLILIFASVGNCFAEGSDIVTSDDKIKELLSLGEYQEGSVVVLLDNSVPITESKSLILNLLNPNRKSNALLDDAELIMDLDYDQEQDNSIVLVQSDKYSTKQLLNKLMSNPRVLTAEPNYIYTLDDSSINSQSLIYDTPEGSTILESSNTDKSEETEIYTQTEIPDYTDFQWAMNHDGADEDLFSMFYDDVTLGDDINLQGWDTYDENGNPVNNASGVIVVCDTGIDYTHPDLKNVMFEIPESIYKEIGGGKYGYNTLKDYAQDDVMDDHFHGTHCAGIIAAEWNGLGTSGVASGVKLVSVKCLSKDGSASFAEIAASLSYVAKLAAKLVNTDTPVIAANFSLGGGYMGCLMGEAVSELEKYGVVLCVAAGNASEDIDTLSYSSTGLDFADNTIIVSASNINGDVAKYSNYGDASDLFAPGTAIVAPVTSQYKTFNSYLDPSPLFKDNFDGSLGEFGSDEYMGAYVETTYDSWLNVGTINNTKGDIDSSCVEITYDEIRERWDEFKKLGMVYPIIAIGVPLEGIDINEIEYLAISVQADNDVDVYSGMYVNDATSNEPNTVRVSGNGIIVVDFKTLPKNMTPYVDEYNNLWLMVAVSNSIYYENTEGSLYIDGITLGYNKLNYAHMNGTSMATPAVTGATAVVYQRYKKLIEKLPLEQRAAYLANIVRSYVSSSNHEDAYNGYCKSGSALDLGTSDLCPVVTSISYENGIISIKGTSFGKTKGSVSVNGENAMVKSWSENLIKIVPNAGSISGFYNIEVESNNGKSCYLVDTFDFGDGVVFDVDIELPDNIRQSTIDLASALNGDEIYVLSSSYDEKQILLSSYNTVTKTWKYISSPKIGETENIHWLENPQMVYAGGKVYIQGTFTDTNDDEYQGFAIYDFAANYWWYPTLVMPAACKTPETQAEDTSPEEIITKVKGISGAKLIVLDDEPYYVGGVYTVSKKGYTTEFVGALGSNYNTENINKLVLNLNENQIIMQGAGYLMQNVLDENGQVIGTTTFGGIFSKNSACSYENTAYIAVAKTWDWPTKDYTPFGYVQKMHNERVENVLFKLELGEDGRVYSTDRSEILPELDFSQDQNFAMALDDEVLVLTAIGGDLSVKGIENIGKTYITDNEALGSFEDTERKASLGFVLGPTALLKNGTLYTMGRSYYEDYENGSMAFMNALSIHSLNDPLSRAKLVMMLWKLADCPYVNYAMSFEDVAEDQIYTEAIRWAQSEGIVEGYSNESFGPKDIVTREQLVTILYRYEQKINGGGFAGTWFFLLDFDDAKQVSTWANEAMHWAVLNKIVQGTSSRTLSPNRYATRSDAEIMLQRYIDLAQ